MSLSKVKRYRKTKRVPATDAKARANSAREWTSIVRGILVAVGDDGGGIVDFEGNPEQKPIPAATTVVLRATDPGRVVVLAFEDGDAQRPIVLGLVQNASGAVGSRPPVELVVDGERLVLNGEKEIVLRSGEASITLTRAGKILIRGAYLLSRSSGVNRIKGGSIQLN
jgi:hypothetical protein